MKVFYNPYNKAFPRGKFLEEIISHLGAKQCHPLERRRYESSFEMVNPSGYHHDLGFLDIVLDNLGLLFIEQFNNPKDLNKYQGLIKNNIGWWIFICKIMVINNTPWWGRYFNNVRRQANSGEPRNILRFFAEENLLNISDDFIKYAEYDYINRDKSAILKGITLHSNQIENILFDDEKIWDPISYLNEYYNYNDFSNDRRYSFLREFNVSNLIPSDLPLNFNLNTNDYNFADYPTGILLDDDDPETINEFKILHPDQSTPDLPLRVQAEASEYNSFKSFVRDQGYYPTCASHAVSVGLDVLVNRQFKNCTRIFSSAWLHWKTASDNNGWNDGRRLGDVVGIIKKSLPCSEKLFPYENARNLGKDFCNDENVLTECDAFNVSYGIPAIKNI